ncbi:hypothetical protein F4782DRAFT_524470 [Xylaria castorea]|nr:hypothetical protein F4782DRAFT_524470 [Xylaria castorea]
MARPQNRKRQHADELSQEDYPRDDVPLAKKIKTRSESEIELDAWASWKYPPEFWDRLSKIQLTRRALEELDRRTKTKRSPPSPRLAPACTTTTPRDLVRFARHGGPDLCDLRGYPEPRRNHPTSGVMSSRQSSRSRVPKSTNPASTLPTSGTTKTRKSTPYNRDFDQHLTDHQIYPIYSSQKPDLTQVKAALVVPRASLSPSKFSEGAFEAFAQDSLRAKDEDDILADVIPTILGPKNPRHPSARNTSFGNFEHLTDGTIAPAKPDIYYGAYPEQLARSAREELSRHIVPSTMRDKPMVPNFFVEVKGPDGNIAVATRQARYDGAMGSRAMHSLQNYGNDEPVYDNTTRTFSSSYHGGQLKLYAHHLTASPTSGGRPGYHMTQLKAYALTNDRETFVDGVTSFRNARDMAKQHRDSFIDAANTRARQADLPIGQNDINDTIEIQHDSGSSPGIVVHDSGSSSSIVVHDPGHIPQDAHDELQRDIWDQSFNETPVITRYRETEEDSQDASQAFGALDIGDPLTSFATTFTSSFSTERASFKRSRQQLYSPPLKSIYK